jgi:hypothetical protein
VSALAQGRSIPAQIFPECCNAKIYATVNERKMPAAYFILVPGVYCEKKLWLKVIFSSMNSTDKVTNFLPFLFVFYQIILLRKGNLTRRWISSLNRNTNEQNQRQEGQGRKISFLGFTTRFTVCAACASVVTF